MGESSTQTPADGQREWARTPAFPVVTARLADDHGLVDGAVVTPGEGQSVREAVVAALAEWARAVRGEQGRIRARVTTADAAGGGEFSAVVTADGQVIDATAPAGAARSSSAGNRRRWWVVGLVALVVLAAGGLAWAGIAVWAQPDAASSAGSAAASSSTVSPGTRTVVPERPPDGFGAVARWSTPVADRSQPVLTPGGLVLSRTDDAVRAHRLVDGARVWQDSLPSDVSSSADTGGLQLTRVGGDWSVALAGNDELSWWPLHGAHHRHHVELPEGADVSFAGPSPLVTVPGGHVRVLTGRQELSDRVVPPGATALAADGDTALAADTDGHTWQLTAENARFPGESESLDAPDGASGTPRVAGVAGRRLLVVWPATDDGDRDKKHRVVALHDPGSAQSGVSERVDATGVSDADWLASPSDSRFGALGDVVVDAHRSSIRQLSGLDPEQVVPGAVYGEQDDDTVGLVRGSDQPQQVGGDLLPVARSAHWALVTPVAEQSTRTRMYAVPADDSTTAATSSSGEGPTAEEQAGQDPAGAAPTPTSKTEPDTADQSDTDEPTPTGKEGE